jgi:hypothetical protein
MRVNKFNPEGYLDITAYEALKTVEHDLKDGYCGPFVYICSPFKGDVKTNIQNARRYSRFAVDQGVIPLAPHLLFPQFMDDANPMERRKALGMGLVLLLKCQELWCFGTHISYGMSLELEKARRKGIRIRRFSESCVEVKHD